MKTAGAKQGFVLTAVMMLIVIASLVGGAFLVSARGTNTTLQKWRDYDECLLTVQAGLEAVNYSLYTVLLNDINANGNRRAALSVLNEESYSDIPVVVQNGFASPPDLDSPSTSGDGVTVLVSVTPLGFHEYVNSNSSDITLECKAKATYGGITRAIQEKVAYNYNAQESLGGSRSVFDNAYFIDNIGMFQGVNCDFNGDIAANLDIDMRWTGSMRVNGNVYAGGIVDSSGLYRSLDWEDYGLQTLDFRDRVRPAEHTDYDTSNPDTYYDQGYAEGVNFYENQEERELPFIGPLSDYEDYANAMGGTVSDASKTVNAVWGDDSGEDAGLPLTPLDDGCLVLIGTAANPINVDGVVVARKDIYIGGYFTGQGSLYAGRNVFVINDLIAVDPPSWPHPDSNPQSTAASNQTKDFMGLCAKGNLIFGNYNTVAKDFKKPPYTESHATDISDRTLGYVTGEIDGEPYFDGDYTGRDGPSQNGLRTDSSDRHYYEPILSDADFNALGVSTRIGWMDAVLYANHLVSGDFASNARINGAVVCRDEALTQGSGAASGNLAINWDARLGSRSIDGMSFYAGLPGMMLPASQPLPTRTIQWTEIDPDDA